MLRTFRQRIGMSQERLALDAEVSARHVSFLETGRSSPSREMVLLLSSALELPLRARNELLGAAGFTPLYAERDLEGPDLAWVKKAIDHVLNAHEPFGAVVFDRAHNILRMNAGAMRLFGWVSEGRSIPPEVQLNLLRAVLHPEGLRPLIVGWEELARQLLIRVRRDAAHRPTEALSALLADVSAYPGVADLLSTSESQHAEGLPMGVVHLRRGSIDMRLFTMVSMIGTPLDVTAQELAIESYHPADRETEELLMKLGHVTN